MGDHKLAFRVVFAASEDSEYPAAELNYHSPQTKGWQSARFCEYPQEVGIVFTDGEISVSQIQLLSHQSKIATRIELFVGQGSDYYDAKFTRLGYLSLDSNERSQYKVRARRAPGAHGASFAARPIVKLALMTADGECLTSITTTREQGSKAAPFGSPAPPPARPTPRPPARPLLLFAAFVIHLRPSSRRHADLQARELKSVYLKARGNFMKLLIHKCYINPSNLFNQVCGLR